MRPGAGTVQMSTRRIESFTVVRLAPDFRFQCCTGSSEISDFPMSILFGQTNVI